MAPGVNTGAKNTKGRPIFKGPKGGEYVLVADKKVYKFTKAPVPVGPSALNLAKKNLNALKTAKNRKSYVRSRAVNMTNANWKELSTYKKILNRRASTNRAAKAVAKKAPVPTARGSPPVPAGYDKTPYMYGSEDKMKPIYKKISSGRYWTFYPSGASHSVTGDAIVTNKRTGEQKRLREFAVGTKAKKAPAPAPVPVAPSNRTPKLPTPSPRAAVRLTTAERNRRLAEIRARLNAIKVKRRVNMPKTRANVHEKLRMALRRTRARRNYYRDLLKGRPTETIKIKFCHAPVSVPRKKCTDRTVDFKVYTGSNPLIDSGSVVAMQGKDFDLDWFKRQSTYMSKLSDYDFWTVQAHTNRSHSWIGPYTYRGNIPRFDALGTSTHIKPLWPQVRKMILNGTYRAEETWVKNFKSETSEKKRYELYSQYMSRMPNAVKKEALEMYKKDLKRIIAGAPRCKKKMILYRGSNFDIFNGNKGHWYKLKSFCSAAYKIDHATIYGSTGFTRITVLPDTPVLLVAGVNQWDISGEYEVMVNIDTQYLIRGRGVTRHLYTASGRHDQYRTTDVIIAK